MTNRIANRFLIESFATLVCFFAIGFSETDHMREIAILFYVICNVILIINSILIWAKKEKKINNISSGEFNRTKFKLIFVGAFVVYYIIIVFCLGMNYSELIYIFFVIPLFCSINIFCALISYYVTLTKEYKSENYKNLLGVEEITVLKGSDDIVVMGILSGKIKKGEKVLIKTFGENNEIAQTIVKKIEVWNYTGKKKLEVRKAKDKQIMLKIENGSKIGIKKGSILYSLDTKMEHIRDAYTNTLHTIFILMQNMELSEEDKAQINLCDCAELWWLFQNYRREHERTQEDTENNDTKSEELLQLLINKLLEAPYIYSLYSKLTGEPYLYSTARKVEKKENRYLIKNPVILFFTDDEKDNIEKEFSNCEIKKIEQKEILDFMIHNFYLNGACGITINNNMVYISADKFNIKPDYSDIPEGKIPITNPDLMRWKLLMGQLDNWDDEFTQNLYEIYFEEFSKELLKAKFLAPMEVIISKERRTVSISLLETNRDRKAIKVYTDWNRLRQVYNEDWGGMSIGIDEMIDTYDYSINFTEYQGVGCFIDKETFEHIKSIHCIEEVEE